MKCCSRSTLGVVIGILNLISCTICIIVCIAGLAHFHGGGKYNEEEKSALDIIFPIVIVICLIMILISGLLITGIVKRRHNLMLPWLILSAIGFVTNCVGIVYRFIALMITGVPIGHNLGFLIISLLLIALSGFILCAIYNLYKDIREDNVNKTGRVMSPAYYKS